MGTDDTADTCLLQLMCPLCHEMEIKDEWSCAASDLSFQQLMFAYF